MDVSGEEQPRQIEFGREWAPGQRASESARVTERYTVSGYIANVSAERYRQLIRSDRNIPAAIGLFFTAPFVAEFLLGNLSIKLLPALIVLAPMYGGAALFIREMVRLKGRGWPSIFVLGAAYTLIEEAFVTQSLFNPDYLKLHLQLLDPAYIPALGIGAWWTLFMFNLHTFWSIAVSIALIEAIVPAQATRPWLGPAGESIVAVLSGFGLIASARFTLKQDPFVASREQFVTAGLVCTALIIFAFMIPRLAPSKRDGPVPGGWLTGLAAFCLGFAVLITPRAWGWGAFAAMLATDLLFLVLVAVLSRRMSWTAMHTWSLAAGGALAYGLHAFIETPAVGGAGMIARTGNAIFLAIALALVVAGANRTGHFGKHIAEAAQRAGA
jgi:hypothetical protein